MDDWSALTIDHIKPVVHGGGNDLDNLQTACHECNRNKGDREYVDIRGKKITEYWKPELKYNVLQK